MDSIEIKEKIVIPNFEEKQKNIEETLYLLRIPGLVKDINNIRKNENWYEAKIFNPDEDE